MDYFLFNFSGVQFHYTMSQKQIETEVPVSICVIVTVAQQYFYPHEKS